MLPQKPHPAHHSRLRSNNISDPNLQSFSEVHVCSSYCKTSQPLCAQTSMPILTLAPTSRTGSKTEQLEQSKDTAHLSTTRCHAQVPYTGVRVIDSKSENSMEYWYKAGTFEASTSSSSSIYSSSERHVKRLSISARSETSQKSNSLVSQSQESSKSTSSSVGATSISINSTSSQGHGPQQHQQHYRRQKNIVGLAGKFVNHSVSCARPRTREKERNPLKWFCHRSDADLPPLKEPNDLHQMKGGNEINLREGIAAQSQIIPQELGLSLIDRMEKIEDKIDALVVSYFSSSRNTKNFSSIVTQQATFSTKAQPEENQQAERVKLDSYSQASSHLQMQSMKEKNHNEKAELQHQKALTAEIDRLTKFNNKLSASVSALGSSGLIEIIEMLVTSIEQLQSELASMRHQQRNIANQQGQLDDIALDQQREQFEIQTKTIQRLGILLGRRDEQLNCEKKMTGKCNELIQELEKKIQSLEVEWRRAISLFSNFEWEKSEL